MGQMMFTKYLVVVDDDVDVHNTSEVLFRLCANTDPQRDRVFTKGPSDVLDHATSEMAIGSKLGIDLQSQPRCTFTKCDSPGINAASI
jgi:4-hydroxy-3-polyprenylbenzoate decarboxylase